MRRKTFLKSIAISTGYLTLTPWKIFGSTKKAKMLKLTTIYNNTSSNNKLKDAWGLAVWIENEKEATLFDTGGDAEIFLKNIKDSELDLSKLKQIVISHDHWDHTNGLKAILEKTNYKPSVYVVENDFDEFKKKYPQAKIIAVSKPKKITNSIWTTGQMEGVYKTGSISEQSIIITKNNSTYLLTGCSHTGIVEMTKRLKNIFPEKDIELVAGGFHLLRQPKEEIIEISKGLHQEGIKKLAPSHCTGEDAIEYFQNDWGKQFVSFNLGDTLTLP